MWCYNDLTDIALPNPRQYYQRVILSVPKIQEIISQYDFNTHYDITDKNNNGSSVVIDKHYH